MDYVQQMDNILKQRTELHTQLTTLQNEHKQIQQENKSLKDEVCLRISVLSFTFIDYLDQIKRRNQSRSEISLSIIEQ